ncbi:MAG TPA: serine/threonine-protein kinase [Nannocystaceae bacterium]|nr:serine/threonine-protein kinase [Nannocystaceae bacterium]
MSASAPLPPALAPLELDRLRGSVRARLFDHPTTLPVVGRYTLLRCIGKGGMGIVYAARDEELGREVAIKLLRAEIAREDDQRLAEEARALARLAHPNVVCVFDVGVHDGQRFIAMEYVVGDNLRRWLGAPRTLREVLQVFVAAGRGLHAAHTVGLVHRDFKPDNVLVGDDGRPRVLDFGLARPPDAPGPSHPPSLSPGLDPLGTALSSAGQVIGTPAYMSPEQYLGEAADARSDQFSFAVALYHAVYGERPFAGDDPQALALSIVRGRLRPIAPRYAVPPWLEQLLERALRVDPAQRFASMDALVAVIQARLELGPDVELDAWQTRSMSNEASVANQPSGLVTPQALLSTGALAPQLPVPLDERSSELASPAESRDDGVITSLSTRRALRTAITEAGLARITRELDRLEDTRGKVVRLGTGLTWSTPALEVHVDLDHDGTRILVWRRLSRALMRRMAVSMVLGFFFGTLGIAIADAIGLLGGDLEAIVILGLLAIGVSRGRRAAHERHARALPAERAQLEFIADRVVQLARAPEPSLALPG